MKKSPTQSDILSPSSHQISLCMKLRLMKKCFLCKSPDLRSQQIYNNLLNRYSNGKEFESLIVIHKVQERQSQGDKIGEQTQKWRESTITNKYNLWSSLSELGGLTYYYRFYQYIPLMPNQKVFNLVSMYKSRKKIMRYNQVWLKYKKHHQENVQADSRGHFVGSERVLTGLSCLQNEMSEEQLVMIEELNLSKDYRNLEEIDSMYNFLIAEKQINPAKQAKIKQKRVKKSTLNVKMECSQKKLLNSNFKGKKSKSCEEKQSLAKNNGLKQKTQGKIRANSPYKKNNSGKVIKKRKSEFSLCKSPEKSKQETEKKLKYHIASLKNKIQMEKSTFVTSCLSDELSSVSNQAFMKNKEKRLKQEKIGNTVKETMIKKLGIKKKKTCNRFYTKSCVNDFIW